MSDANCYVDLGNWYPGPCSQTQNTFLNISNNYSNGNSSLMNVIFRTFTQIDECSFCFIKTNKKCPENR